MHFYIAQTAKQTQPVVSNQLPPFSFFLPFLTALLGLVGGVVITRYSSHLTEKRENAKKQLEKLEDAEEMKMGNQILEAVNLLRSDMTKVIDDQGKRLDKAIADQGSRLDKAIADQGSRLDKAIVDQGQSLGQRISSLETATVANTTAIAVLNRTVEERVPRRPLEIGK
jgi:hypothetical protein